MNISTWAAPGLLCAEGIEGTAVVVIDALRMTSVAAAAKANGCAGLLAVAEVDEARRLAAREGALLGGERDALRIEGFDLDNSPLAYTRERVAGRRIVMTTTNGTRAIAAAQDAKRLLLGALVNARAVARAISAEEHAALLCAGTAGAFTLEDALAAGAILDRLREMGIPLQMDDMSIAACMLYGAARGDLFAALAGTRHCARLLRGGMEADVRYCLSEDTLCAVPERGEGGWFA